MFIGVRVPEELKSKIEEICTKEGKSISEVTRELLEEYVQFKEEEWHRVKISLKVPDKIYKQVEMFVDYGYYNSVEEAMNSAIRLWLRVEKREYEEKWDLKMSEALSTSRL